MNGENVLEQLDNAYVEIHQLRHALTEIAKVVGSSPIDQRDETALRHLVDAVSLVQSVAEESSDLSLRARRGLGLLDIAKKLYLQLREIEQEPATVDGAEREADVRASLEAALGIGDEERG